MQDIEKQSEDFIKILSVNFEIYSELLYAYENGKLEYNEVVYLLEDYFSDDSKNYLMFLGFVCAMNEIDQELEIQMKNREINH